MTDTQPSTAAIRDLNDEARASLTNSAEASLAQGELVVTNGVAGRGWHFVDRALSAVRRFIVSERHPFAPVFFKQMCPIDHTSSVYN